MTLVDKAELTAALAERDAARAEVARLRAAVESVCAQSRTHWHVVGQDESSGYMVEQGDCVDVDDILAATEDQP